MKKLDYKITDASHIPAAFRPAPQSCTSSTLLPHMTKAVSRYAILSATFIIKQALTQLRTLKGHISKQICRIIVKFKKRICFAYLGRRFGKMIHYAECEQTSQYAI